MHFFSRLFGQERVKEVLLRLWKNHRIPHTMIFYGDEGLGKTTAAFETAALLTGDGFEWHREYSLWSDETFLKYPALTLGDETIWYLHPQGLELKVEQFRLFLQSMTVFDERVHVCIIDEAQTMMPTIANALLKTLEEPRENVYFILITHDLRALLPTIVSRGMGFHFEPLSLGECREWMERTENQLSVPAGLDFDSLYELAEGHPGVIEELCYISEEREPEEAMRFWECMTMSRTPFFSLGTQDYKDRKAFLRKLRWIRLVGRDLMVLAETEMSDAVRCRQILQRELKVAPYWRDGKAEAALSVLETAMEGVMRYISVKNVWDAILIQTESIRKGDMKWNK